MADTTQAERAGRARVKRPTLKTIAEMTGLAVTTVSRALSDAPEIAIETRKRVAAAAREVGYVPDRAARRLRTGRTNVISLILTPHDELIGFSNSITMGLSRAMKGTHFNLLVTPSFDDRTELDLVQNIVRNALADGVVFSRTQPFDDRIRFLQEQKFPFVCHGRSEFAQPHLYVDYDNEAFARLAVERLVAKGRKRLLAVMPDRKFTFYSHLRYGFTSAAMDAGVQFDIPEEIDLTSDPADVTAAVARRMAGPNPPDGFICAGEVLALAVMSCLADQGRVVGVDADIVAKQSSSLFDHIRPRIDTIYENIAETGERIGTMLLRQIAQPDDPGTGFILDPEPHFLPAGTGVT